ncbi:hypothetical protein L249_4205 [Ophiocordyceps polyrhachis-furcata BCC 54312]|uniref:Uncharacterized protein n=1 Tax=Ophiocordyceps polyrhachis-furcata BCC 54312 TaxID=1330021 RepID=A0A367LBT3_9HYPO|nr:hypothetical protein L249_4205 [Ophiocordyceps polyrhachis-furcata BCC 54312]
MPSTSHQRSPANTSRKTRPPSSTQETAEEAHERLFDQLKNANTQLNKAVSDRDRYQRLYEQLNQSLSDAHADKEELKNQVHCLKDDKAALKRDLHALQKENEKLRQNIDAWDQNYTFLERSRDELALQLQATSHPPKLPERPKARGPSRERKAEKERLSRRFDDRRPPRNNGFGDVVSPARAYAEAFSSVPRTVVNPPYNMDLYKVAYEDGAYHPHPLSR